MGQYIPKQDDIVYINFSPQSGHEQAGFRPVIVLSLNPFNAGRFAVVCPSQVKKRAILLK